MLQYCVFIMKEMSVGELSGGGGACPRVNDHARGYVRGGNILDRSIIIHLNIYNVDMSMNAVPN